VFPEGLLQGGGMLAARGLGGISIGSPVNGVRTKTRNSTNGKKTTFFPTEKQVFLTCKIQTGEALKTFSWWTEKKRDKKKKALAKGEKGFMSQTKKGKWSTTK